MPIRINGSYLVPAPLVTFNKTFTTAPNGTKLGAEYSITMQGYLLPNKGNPVATSGSVSFSSQSWASSYSPDDDQVIANNPADLLLTTINKQEAIRQLFSTGALIEILGYNSTKGMKFYGVVQDINFESESRWALPTPYSVTLKTHNFLESPVGLFSNNSTEDNFGYYISDFTEDWSLQETDQVTINSGNYTEIHKVYAVTHNLNAVGSPVYTSSGTYLNNRAPWQQASGYVRAQIFGQSGIPQNFLLPSSYNIANHKYTENINKLGGSYGIQEDFILYDSGLLPYPVIETVTVSTERGEDGINSVSIQGTINGLETNNPYGSGKANVSKYNNALNYYNNAQNVIYTRARDISGLTWLHPKALTESVSKDISAGSISYTRSFNNRPPNLIPNSISENIDVSDTYPGQIVSEINCIGRSQPIIQYLNSRSAYNRTLSINITVNPIAQNWLTSSVNSSGYWTAATVTGIRNWLISQKPSVVNTVAFSAIYSAVNPSETGAVSGKVFYQAPTESWNPRTGSYSYSVTWVYEKS